MAVNTSNLTVLGKALNKAFEDKIELQKPQFEGFYETIQSNSDIEVYNWLSQVPTFQEMAKNEKATGRDLKVEEFAVANKDYKARLSISQNDIDDKKISGYTSIAGQIGAKAALLPDFLIRKMLNGAFTTTKAYDGLPLCDSGHLAGIKAVNNTSTAALSKTSFEAAIASLLGFSYQADAKSELEGLNDGVELMLVVPHTLRVKAKEIVEALLISGGDSNINAGSAKVKIITGLASSTAWFLINIGSTMKPFMIQERQKPELKEFNASNSQMANEEDAVIYLAKGRYGSLVTFPWLVYGSTGTA